MSGSIIMKLGEREKGKRKGKRKGARDRLWLVAERGQGEVTGYRRFWRSRKR